MPADSVYLPLCVGAALGNRTLFAGDDTGDSISEKIEIIVNLQDSIGHGKIWRLII